MSEPDRILYRFDAIGSQGTVMGGVVEGLTTVEQALEHAYTHLEEGHMPIVIRRNGEVIYDAEAIRLEWEALKLRTEGPSLAAFRAKLAAVQARQRCTVDQDVLTTLHAYACELQGAIHAMEMDGC